MARSRYMVGLVFLVFFVMSLLTNILGPIVPDIINSFKVSLTAAALLPFSFFIAYGVVSIPAGFWVERYTRKARNDGRICGRNIRLSELRALSRLFCCDFFAVRDGRGHGDPASRG